MKKVPVGAVKILPYLAAGLAILATTGCATKKYVRTTVAPIEARVAQTEKKNAEQSSSIEGLENDVSRTKERVQDVDARANAASQAAQTADKKAVQAGSVADNARMLAEKGITQAGALERSLEQYGKFHAVANERILFAFGSSALDAQAKTTLDAIATQAGSHERSVIELQGFTDRTGRPAYNLALSQQRAQAVARYLAVTHKIPLRSIHLLGAGSEAPAADNRSRDGRRQNRRVEVSVFAPETSSHD
jgi:OmpA-OmpF porin, OOP family